MERSEVQKLSHGLYLLFWKTEEGGGSSLASVGSLYDGGRWFAPTNWTTSVDKPFEAASGKAWEKVEKALLLVSWGSGKDLKFFGGELELPHLPVDP